jgi:hypothetical protein
MASAHEIQTEGMKRLKEWLDTNKRTFRDSDNKTFDLIVDEEYAELKAKGRGWCEFDFISLTKNQKKALGSTLKRIFLVLNALDKGKSEVLEISGESLKQLLPREIRSYEYRKGILKILVGR